MSCQSDATQFQRLQTEFGKTWGTLYQGLPFGANTIYDVSKLKEESPLLEKTLEGFNRIDADELSFDENVDFFAMKNLIEKRVDFLENKIKKDPTIFSLKKEIENLIEPDNQNEKGILDDVLAVLNRFPKFYDFAKTSLNEPELEKINLALEEQTATYFLLKNELANWGRRNATTSLATNHFSKKNKEAQLVIKDWIAFLNSAKFEIGNE